MVFVAGLSMGGTLMMALSNLIPSVAGLILINHALFLNPDRRLLFLPIIKYFMLSDKSDIGGDLKDKNAYEVTYDRLPTRGVHEMVKLIKHVKKKVTKISQPTLVLKSKEDHVIPIKSAVYTFKQISSKTKELIWLDNSLLLFFSSVTLFSSFFFWS